LKKLKIVNRNWTWVYNPFIKIAGWKAFGIGIVILCLATVIGYFGNTVFYGISVKSVLSLSWCKAFSLQAMGLTVTVLVMWIIALLSAKHVRFQDILGTVTLAKYPLVLMAIMFLAFSNWLNELSKMLLTSTNTQEIMEFFSQLTILDYVLFMVFIILTIFFLVWTIALLFNAFRVSTNLKGGKCTMLFIVSLLVSEIIIGILVSMCYK